MIPAGFRLQLPAHSFKRLSTTLQQQMFDLWKC